MLTCELFRDTSMSTQANSRSRSIGWCWNWTDAEQSRAYDQLLATEPEVLKGLRVREMAAALDATGRVPVAEVGAPEVG
jgi:hypothetical protein